LKTGSRTGINGEDRGYVSSPVTGLRTGGLGEYGCCGRGLAYMANIIY